MSIFERIDEESGIDLPVKANAGDAGYDLQYWGDEPVILSQLQRELLSTGVRLREGAIDGAVGLICPRSGLAWSKGLTVLNAPGVIDSGYTGELKVNMINLDIGTGDNNKYRVIKPGDRVAQLVIVDLVGWTSGGTTRGDGGHGSSGD